MRIQTKMTAVFSGVIALLMLVAAMFGYYFFKQYLTEKIEEKMATSVIEQAQVLDSNLLSKQKLLEISWYNLNQVMKNGQISADLLAGYKQADPELTDMYFGSVTGRFVDGSGWKPPADYDPRQRPWYKEAIEAGKITITAPYFDLVEKQMALSIAMPVRNEAGEIYGVVATDLPLARLLDKMKWADMYEGSYGYLLNESGTVLAHPDQSLVTQNVFSLDVREDLKDAVRLLQQQDQGIARYMYGEASKIVFFKRVPALQATLALAIPENIVYAPLEKFRNGFMLAVIILLLAITLLSFPAFRRISEPLEILVDQVKRVGSGDLTVSVAKPGYDELDELASCFNDMVKNLQASFDEINRQSRESIEQVQSLQEATSHLITEADSMEQLFAAITKDVDRIIGCTYSIIATIEGDRWVVQQGSGQSPLQQGDSFKLEEGLVGEVLRRNEIVFVPHYERYRNALSSLRGRKDASYIALPLQVNGQVVGALSAGWEDLLDRVDAKRDVILRQYANIAAVAIARLQDRDEMYQLAYVDPLTKLPNRLWFYQQLQNNLGDKDFSRYGHLFLLDMDNLKLINDSLGHSHGDYFIRYVADVLRQEQLDNSLIARLGGDEFCFWVSDGGDPGKIAAAVLQAIESSRNDGEELRITASMGIAEYPRDGITVEELMQNADAALYEAKYGGKNIWRMCSKELLLQNKENLFLSNALRGAIDGNELTLVFQPIVAMDRSLIGFESLLRWKNDVHGAVSPAKFIPLAEQCGMMPAIGRWVLEQAASFAQELRQQGMPNIRVHVNVSVKQMEDDDFSSMVENIMQHQAGMQHQLIMEVTESVFMESMNRAIASLNDLKETGFSIAMDDFGEGFSSLAQLLRLPFDSLKISRTLIKNLGAEQRHLQYIAAIVEMMHALKLEVVAEGVETEEEWKSVGICGFDLVQGYYIARPLRREDALAWARRNDGHI